MQVQEILTASIVFIPAAYALYIVVQFASGLVRLGSRSIAPVTAPLAKPLQSEIVATESKSTATEHATEVTPVPAAMASAQAEVASGEAEPGELAKNSVFPIALKTLSSGDSSVNTPPIKNTWNSQSVHIDLAAISGQWSAEISPVDTPIALLPAFIPAVQVEATADDHALIESAWIRLYCNAGVHDVVVPFTRPLSAVQKPQQAHPAIDGMTLRAMRQLGAELHIKGCRRWNTQQAIEQLTHYYSSKAA